MNIEKLAELARIELNKAEQKELQKDIESILEFISKLKELPDENEKEIIPEHRNIFREDKITAIRKPIRLSDSRKLKDGFIKVKNVFEKNG